MRVDLKLEVDVDRTSRVVQLEGLFDLPDKKRTAVDYHFDVPVEERPWQIGLIVGPSGAGKSSVARHLFPTDMVAGYDWHTDRSVVDSFGELPIREVTAALSSVGFSSPPSWIKPFRVLSNGEQFRATLARAILDPRPLIVMDEFTSVVDRTVARIGSNAVAKAVRARPGKQFVAVSCHDDIIDWLQPDWIIEPHVSQFTWRSVRRRPTVHVEVHRALPAAWRFFHAHHYLAANLHPHARCFVATIDGNPAGFWAILPLMHARVKNTRRIHRVVVLPDYQGLGLSMSVGDLLGAIAMRIGYRLLAHPAHPALIKTKARSSTWRMTRAPAFRPPHGRESLRASSTTWYRRIASFEYCGPPWPDEAAARALWGNDTLNRPPA